MDPPNCCGSDIVLNQNLNITTNGSSHYLLLLPDTFCHETIYFIHVCLQNPSRRLEVRATCFFLLCELLNVEEAVMKWIQTVSDNAMRSVSYLCGESKHNVTLHERPHREQRSPWQKYNKDTMKCHFLCPSVVY